jgi:hypothetical protein
VVTRLALALIGFAAGRWPAHLRTDLRREWLAELHVLLSAGERSRALSFAASLAVSRPAQSSTVDAMDRSTMNLRAWSAAVFLIVAPTAFAVAVAVSTAPADDARGNWLRLSVGPIVPAVAPVTFVAPFALVLALIGLLAWLAGRHAVPGHHAGMLTAAVVVSATVGILFVNLPGGDGLASVLPGTAVWLVGLAVVLRLVLRARTAGQAWRRGVVGVALTCEVALTLAISLAASAGAAYVVAAPLWLPSQLIAWSTPTGVGTDTIGIVEAYPYVLVTCSVFVLAFVLGVRGAGAPDTEVTGRPAPPPDQALPARSASA